MYIAAITFYATLVMNTKSNEIQNESPSIRVRRFQETDTQALLQIFQANILEEWTKYHEGKYLPNAKKYIDSVLKNPSSDLLNIEKTYFEPGGYFWVAETTDGLICGMTGLEITGNEGEVRRMCILPPYRAQGLGTAMCNQLLEHAENLSIKRVFLSTPEHGKDVLRFYGRLGFVDTGKRGLLHESPIQEVFLERNSS